MNHHPSQSKVQSTAYLSHRVPSSASVKRGCILAHPLFIFIYVNYMDLKIIYLLCVYDEQMLWGGLDVEWLWLITLQQAIRITLPCSLLWHVSPFDSKQTCSVKITASGSQSPDFFDGNNLHGMWTKSCLCSGYMVYKIIPFSMSV